jgi:hypothetical protein
LGGNLVNPGRAERLLIAEEPANFAEAEPHEAWRRAMLEMASIEDNETWSLTELPAGHRPIGLKWVFKIKRDADGVVIKHKARLMAKGYVQREGVDSTKFLLQWRDWTLFACSSPSPPSSSGSCTTLM